MTKRATDPPGRGKPRGRTSFPRITPWMRGLLASTVVAVALGGATSAQAGNGEPPSGEGLYTSPFCAFDFTIDCDDRFAGDVVSCHMRGPQGDEGFAQKACIDGRITIGAAGAAGEAFLEKGVTIQATDFGELSCGEEGGIGFCTLCETQKGATTSTKKGTVVTPGTRKCVKIVNDGQPPAPLGTCGAFNVTTDTSGACLAETQDLQQNFSDPRVGFFVNMDASDAGQPGTKDLVLCGRSWECIDNPSATQAEVQQPQPESLIDTPCCTQLLSGAWYCSSLLKTSSTCK